MLKSSLLLASLLLLGAAAASAGTICPTVTPDPGITDVSGCNVLITFDAGGTPSVSVVDLHPYEGVEDQLVGVINNSLGTVTSIDLTGTDIFGFDGDGICAGYISASLCATGDGTGYGPNGVTFTTVDSDTGTVHFSPGIDPGGTGFFSLEEGPTTGGGGVTIGGVPEPTSLALMGSGLAALYFVRRRKTRA